MNNTNQSSNEGFLRLPEVLKLIPVSKSTWWAGVKSGRYPKSIKLSDRITAWRVDEIRQLMHTLESAND
ncbi:MAG: AlpA family phage regulatory protein [Bacteroidetes bacterium]|nr:AlpA family phage regulatory protein [Bacteroidota bacterium]